MQTFQAVIFKKRKRICEVGLREVCKAQKDRYKTQRAQLFRFKRNKKSPLKGICYRDFLVGKELAHCLRLRSIVRYTLLKIR